MYRITYFVQGRDESGKLFFQPEYDIFFQTTDPSHESNERKLLLLKASFARRFPQYEVVYGKIISEGWV